MELEQNASSSHFCRFKAFFCSSIGRKMVMALTGLGLSGFLLVHMSGNLLLLCGAQSYNIYAHKLISNPLIEFAEGGLVAMFGLHILLAISLTRQNRDSRPDRYQSCARGNKRVGLPSRTMIYSGLLILVFLVLHLISFKYGTVYMVTYDGLEVRDLYKLVLEKFKDPVYVGWYVFSMAVLAMHLSHGIASVFQSLGLASAKKCSLRLVAAVIAVLLCGGFVVQPLYLFFKGV